MTKTHRTIADMLHPHGLTLTATANGHYKIMHDGRMVDVLSGSPKDQNAHKNTIRRLRAKGLVPDALCRVKF